MIPNRSNHANRIVQFKIRAEFFHFVAVVCIIGSDVNELCEDRACENGD